MNMNKTMSHMLPTAVAILLVIPLAVVGCNRQSVETEMSTVATTSSTKTTTSANRCCSDEKTCCGNCDDSTSCECDGSTNCQCSESEQQQEQEQEKEPATTSSKPEIKTFTEDRDLFRYLLANNDKITRKVTELDNGVETVTESTDPQVIRTIQEHVASMYHRVEDVRPIRMRDPLYRELFKHTKKIKMELENTEHGIRVMETSDDDYVVKLIQAHAKVVSGFVKNGFEEARKNHQPPKRQDNKK